MKPLNREVNYHASIKLIKFKLKFLKEMRLILTEELGDILGKLNS